MKNIKLPGIISLAAILFLAIATCALFGSSEPKIAPLKGIFICFIFILGFLIWNFMENAHLNKKVLEQYDNLEKLLIDLRDGTQKFHKEKRRFDRKDCVMMAKLPNDQDAELVKVIDISYTGALLRTAKTFTVGDNISISLYLPIFAQPIEVAGFVARVDSGIDDTRKPCFDIGVEFHNISPKDKEKLIEAVDLINKHPEERH